MSITSRIIEGALPITAKLLADDLGLKIHFGAEKFKASEDETGGKHLHIPALPLDDVLASALALGGIVHEDSHFNATDFQSMRIADQNLKQMTNILEDVRCEGVEIKRYPGARALLARMVAAMVENGQFSPIGEMGLGGIPWYILYRLRSDLLGQVSLRPLAVSAAEEIRPQMPGASFQRLTAMMYEVVECQSTADCVDLAQQILTMFKEEAENPSPPDEQQQPEEQQLGQESQSDGGDAKGSGGQPSGQQATGSDGAGTQQTDGNPDQGAAGSDAGDGTETSQGSGMPTNGAGNEGDKREAMTQFLAGSSSGEAMDIGNMIASVLESISRDSESVRLPDAIPVQDTGEGENALARLRAETNAVRRKVQSVLEAKARTTIFNGRSGNRLDPKRLWRVRTGDARVFEKRIEGHKQDTAVQLLIDRSTSMRDRIHIACDAALAVAMALDGVQGVTTSVAAFPYTGNGQSDDVLLISAFGESFRRTAARFPAVGVQGWTPMAEAILWSGLNLHSTNKTRKILVVVTDGAPDCMSATVDVIDKLEKSGVEVMGLGINVDVDALFTTSAKIGSIGELAVAMFGMLQETLAKAA